MDGHAQYQIERHLKRLQRELDKTWRERNKAVDEFDSLVRQVPSMLPEPDGSLRIRQAREKMSRAIKAHSKLVKEYVDLFMQRSRIQ